MNDLKLFSIATSKKSFARLPIVFFAALVCACLVFSSVSPSYASSQNPRYASLVIDANTGMVLHQRYADKKLYPASLTKVMTLLMLFDSIERGQTKLNDRIRISHHAASMVPSKIGLAAGSTIKVEDAILALVTKSANDIAAAVAEHLGGTESNFAHMMTRRARTMGMANTTFKNASGLHDPGQITTARDMAKLARVVIQSYPDYYRYFSTKNFSYNGHNYHNHNRLMDTYEGMDGMKTGYIQASGFNLVASAVRNNQRLIGVVFGGRSTASRNAHMASILDQSFSKMHEVRVATTSVPLPPRKPGVLVALNTINQVARATGEAQKTTAYDAGPEDNGFGELIGEGDYDVVASRRIETGLVAISAIKGEVAPATRNRPVLTSYNPAQETSSWSVQIGAFTSRAATDQALHESARKLPRQYANATPMIAPLRTQDGWLFRGRFIGYTKAQAFEVCKALRDCMPVAPQTN